VSFPTDRLVLTPQDIDLARSPLAGKVDAETHVLGAFNPGLTRLANGNLLLMVRVAEALTKPIASGAVHAIRWEAGNSEARGKDEGEGKASTAAGTSAPARAGAGKGTASAAAPRTAADTGAAQGSGSGSPGDSPHRTETGIGTDTGTGTESAMPVGQRGTTAPAPGEQRHATGTGAGEGQGGSASTAEAGARATDTGASGEPGAEADAGQGRPGATDRPANRTIGASAAPGATVRQHTADTGASGDPAAEAQAGQGGGTGTADPHTAGQHTATATATIGTSASPQRSALTGTYTLDAWPLELADTADPRKFLLHGHGWKVMALTSLSWLLPVELTPDGLKVVHIHYDKAIAPAGPWQCYGIEDARISRLGDRYLMTTCSVSPERHSTTLYSSSNALDWTFEGIVLDHQNKDMLIFEGQIGGKYWAQTRPLGDLYFAYPPGSPFHAGPSINLASSPDAHHWQPCLHPHIRPHAGTPSTARIGGGSPPILTEIAGQRGWLTLWHGVEPNQIVGIYRTYWTLLDPDEPWKVIATSHPPLLEPRADLTEPLRDQMYLDNVTFTTGIVEEDDHFIVASGEADLACRITHVPKDAFVPSKDSGAQ